MSTVKTATVNDKYTRTESRLTMKRKGRITAVVRYLILFGVGILMLYPLFWLVGASFKTNEEIFSEIWFWPKSFDFASYVAGWKTSSEFTFATYFLNSFTIIIPRILVTIVSCVVVGYGFARFQFWGKKILFGVLVSSFMLPQVVLRVPQYLMFKTFGWLDTYLPWIVPSAFAIDVFFVFMMVQFLRGIPKDMEEAAQIDGCNAPQILWYILVPIIKPAIVSIIVFQFIWTMNDFMGPLIYLSSVSKYPISLALKMSVGATEEVKWANVIAMSVVALVPSLLIFFSAQKYFVDGIATSGIKG
jgi:oligogalacturonide transport system permease protein